MRYPTIRELITIVENTPEIKTNVEVKPTLNLPLSRSEKRALEYFQNNDKDILISTFDDRDDDSEWYGYTPGLNTIRKLQKKGLVDITDEDTIDLDGGDTFTFTQSVFLTDLGRKYIL
jgi:hypothetical protein